MILFSTGLLQAIQMAAVEWIEDDAWRGGWIVSWDLPQEKVDMRTTILSVLKYKSNTSYKVTVALLDIFDFKGFIT